MVDFQSPQWTEHTVKYRTELLATSPTQEDLEIHCCGVATPPFPLKSLDLLLLLLVVLTVALTPGCADCGSYLKVLIMTSETWHFICWKYGSLAVDSSVAL